VEMLHLCPAGQEPPASMHRRRSSPCPRATMTSAAGPGVSLAGRYRLDCLVAAGAAGVVWRAFDLLLGRNVAVKVLRPDSADDPEARARFRAEARNASRLSHPGVAQVYDYGEDGPPDLPFLVMELVDGPSLVKVLAAGPLDPAQTLDLIAQVGDGLHAAHSAGLVHRDIKPANLLITGDGQVKITDFGIASVTSGAPSTAAGVLIGTRAYLAPERAAGWRATPASDLYSLGVVGYECLTGAPPFHGAALQVAEAHVRCPLQPGRPAGRRGSRRSAQAGPVATPGVGVDADAAAWHRAVRAAPRCAAARHGRHGRHRCPTRPDQ
jgi:serine/threonine protein kinase